MKKKTILLILAIAAVLPARALRSDYSENMARAKKMLDTATMEKTLLMAASYFDRIARMNPGEWLPSYYASYCYVRISHLINDGDTRDTWVDRAQAEIDKASDLAPNHSEVVVMMGFVLQARMDINPTVRGFRYFSETMKYFDRAMEIDPDNPRPYLWKGVNLLHTPEAFGGGTDKACPLIGKALEKFAAFVPADSLAPDWGYSYAREMAEKCK